MVSELPDDEVLRIGSEPGAKKETREKLLASIECLRDSLTELNVGPPERSVRSN